MPNKAKKEKMKTLIQVFALLAVVILLVAAASLKLFYQAETTSISVDIALEETSPINDLIYGTQVNLSGLGGGVLKRSNSGPGAIHNQRAVRPLQFDEYFFTHAQDLKLPAIRWGVNNVFDWRATVGPIEERPMRYYNKTRAESFEPDPQTFGTDELVWFGRSLNPDMQFTFLLPIIYGHDETRLYIDGDWRSDVQKANQSGANLVEYANTVASETVKQRFTSGEWQPSDWQLDEPLYEQALIDARNYLYKDDPDKQLSADRVAALRQTYLFEVCDQVSSWCSWQDAPAGYFAGLRWHFAKQREQDGESYLLDGDPYDVKYWEYGNEVNFRGPTRTNRPFGQPKIYGDNYVIAQNMIKAVDPSVQVSPTIWGTVSGHMMWNEGYVWNFGSAKMTVKQIMREENLLKVRVDRTNHGINKQLPTDKSGTLLKLTNFSVQSDSPTYHIDEYLFAKEINYVSDGDSQFAEFVFENEGLSFNISNMAALDHVNLSIEGVLGPVVGITNIESLPDHQTRVWLERIDRRENHEDYFIPFVRGDMVKLENLPIGWQAMAESELDVIASGKTAKQFYLDFSFNSSELPPAQFEDSLVAMRTPAFVAADGLILHQYSTPSPSCGKDQIEYDSLIYGVENGTSMDMRSNANMSVLGNSARMALIQEYTNNRPLFITEHNIEWGVQSAIGCGHHSEGFRLKAGLANSLVFNQFIRQGVGMANFFHLSNNTPHGDSGAWQEHGRFNDHDIWRAISKYEHIFEDNPANNVLFMESTTPSYHIWRQYSEYAIGELLKTETGGNDDLRIDVLAVKNNEQINILITNMDALQERSVDINLPSDLNIASSVAVSRVTSKTADELDLDILERLSLVNGQYNMMEASNEVVNSTGFAVDTEVVQTLQTIHLWGDQIIVPAHSLSIYQLQIVGEPEDDHVTLPANKYTRGINMLSFPHIQETNFNFLTTSGFSTEPSDDPLLGGFKSKIQKYDSQRQDYVKHSELITADPEFEVLSPQAASGYFVRVYQGESIAESRYKIKQKDSYTVALAEGWNLLGNPFERDMDIREVRINTEGQAMDLATAMSNRLCTDYFWSWDRRLQGTGAWRFISSNPKYIADNKSHTLESFSGFWIYAFQPNLQIVLR